MSDENKGIARRFIEEAFNKGNLDVLDELIAPDYVTHDPLVPPDLPPGPEGVRQLVSMYRSAFPDVRLTVEDQVAEGDKVVTRWSGRGTHDGDFVGVPATGKQGTTTGISLERISGGKIAETWVNWDTLGLMQQLGAIPEPATA